MEMSIKKETDQDQKLTTPVIEATNWMVRVKGFVKIMVTGLVKLPPVHIS